MKLAFPTSSFWRRLPGAALLLSLGAAPAAHAQITWYPAVTNDIQVGRGNNAANTGCEHVPLNGQTLRVMCWDGTQPEIGLSLSPDELPGRLNHLPFYGSRFGTVTDPDIVANPGNFGDRGGTTTNILSAYLLNGAVCYEVQRYDANNPGLSFVAFQTLAGGRTGGSNPNVDVDGEGHAVITWSQINSSTGNQSIYVQTVDLTTGQPVSPICEVAGEPGFNCTQPDVAISHAGEKIVSLIFLATDRRGNQTVRMTQISRFTLDFWASYGTNFNGAGIDVLPGRVGQFDAPRIAAPPLKVGFSNIGDSRFAGDFEAVVADLNSNSIIGLNRINTNGNMQATDPNSLPTIEFLNQIGGLDRSATCSKPAVSYCGDVINVAWTMTDGDLFGSSVPASYRGTQEVVRTVLTHDGVPQNRLRRGGWYSIVNRVEADNQAVPSVAGRYADYLSPNAVATGKTLYCFYEEDVPSPTGGGYYIAFKSSDATASSLRPAATATTTTPQQPIAAYPNPFTGSTTLTLTLADKEGVESLQVYDPTGQPVRNLQLPEAGTKGTQQVRWAATSLKAGLYLVRLRTSTGAVYTYRVQHD